MDRKCTKCGNKWKSRVAHPVECPACKRRDWDGKTGWDGKKMRPRALKRKTPSGD